MTGFKHLQTEGLITVAADASHKQKKNYSLTEKAIQLVPIIAQLGAWGAKHTASTSELSIRASLLADGGPPLWEDFMKELRHLHLAEPIDPNVPSVLEKLDAAYHGMTGNERKSR